MADWSNLLRKSMAWAQVFLALWTYQDYVVGQQSSWVRAVVAELPGPVTSMVFVEAPRESIWVASEDHLYECQWRFDRGHEITFSFERRVALPFKQITRMLVDEDRGLLLVGGGDPGESGSVAVIDMREDKLVRHWEIHSDSVAAMAFSPNREFLATGSWDGTIAVVDGWMNDFQVARSRTFTGHTGGVRGLIWVGPDFLISGAEDHTVRTWNVVTGEMQRTMELHTAGIVDLVPITAGNDNQVVEMVSIGQDRTVRLWQPILGRMVRFVRLEAQPISLFFPEGGCFESRSTSNGQTALAPRCVLVGDDAGKIKVIDMELGRVIETLDLERIDWVESLVWLERFGWGLAGLNGGAVFRFFREN